MRQKMHCKTSLQAHKIFPLQISIIISFITNLYEVYDTYGFFCRCSLLGIFHKDDDP